MYEATVEEPITAVLGAAPTVSQSPQTVHSQLKTE